MDSTCTKNRRLVGARIRSIRKAQDLSLRTLGLMVGMDHATLSKIENGKLNPSLNTLSKIADGLDVELFELFDVRESPDDDTTYSAVKP